MTKKSTVLRPYQAKAVKELTAKPKLCLFAKPGLGKTIIMLEHIKNLKAAGKVKHVLLVSTIRIIHNVWPDEIKKWGYDLTCSVVHGTLKQRINALKKNVDIYLINFESLQWFDTQNILMDALIIDELTFLKNTQSKRFKALKKDLEAYEYRYGLTGSPLTRNYEDLFGEIYMVAGDVLGRNITHYRNKYFSQGISHWQRFIRNDAKKEIADLIAPYVHVIPLEGNVDLPDILYNNIVVDLPPEARLTYNKLKTDLVVTLGGVTQKNVVALQAATAATKLQQIANGAVYTSTETGAQEDAWELVHNAKLDALDELIQALGDSPCLVAYNFRHDLERLLERFPGAPYLGSGVSSKKAAETINKWNAGEVPILFLHPASAGHGINLQGGAGHTIVWFGLTYNFNFYEQTNKRLHRSGQKSNVIVHHIIARDTIDTTVLNILNRKDSEQVDFIKLLVEILEGDKRA